MRPRVKNATRSSGGYTGNNRDFRVWGEAVRTSWLAVLTLATIGVLSGKAMAEWLESSKEDGFSVLLPAAPTRSDEASTGARNYEAKWGCTYFSIGRIREHVDGEAGLMAIVKKVGDHFGSQFQTQVTPHDAKYRGHTSVRYWGEIKQGVAFTMSGLVVSDGKSTFDVHSLEQAECDDRGWVSRFLDSFRFLGEDAPAP